LAGKDHSKAKFYYTTLMKTTKTAQTCIGWNLQTRGTYWPESKQQPSVHRLRRVPNVVSSSPQRANRSQS
jgi:hypothetical protein